MREDLRFGFRQCTVTLALALTALGSFGCEAQRDTADEPLAPAATPATPSAAATPAAAPAGSIQVELVDYAIEMPASLPSGPTTLHVVNNGTHEHNFEVEGQGIEQELARNLQPGEAGTLEVELQPGTYTVYCPVEDHRERGMEVTLTVQ